MYKFYSTRDMVRVPNLYEMFRVGEHVGKCVLKTKKWVVMKK